jgi:hypothetical protein
MEFESIEGFTMQAVHSQGNEQVHRCEVAKWHHLILTERAAGSMADFDMLGPVRAFHSQPGQASLAVSLSRT